MGPVSVESCETVQGLLGISYISDVRCPKSQSTGDLLPCVFHFKLGKSRTVTLSPGLELLDNHHQSIIVP